MRCDRCNLENESSETLRPSVNNEGTKADRDFPHIVDLKEVAGCRLGVSFGHAQERKDQIADVSKESGRTCSMKARQANQRRGEGSWLQRRGENKFVGGKR